MKSQNKLLILEGGFFIDFVNNHGQKECTREKKGWRGETERDTEWRGGRKTEKE